MKTSEWLKKYDIRLKKGLGQNFLSNSTVSHEIVKKSEIDENDVIIEIGTGNGILTEEIAKKAKKVITFEIDERLKPLLEERFEGSKNVEIHFEDFLNTDLSKFKDIPKLKYIANIPYYISSKILEKIFEESPKFEYAIFMFQKEFGQRLMAKSKKSYSPLSIFVQTYCTVERIMDVSKNNFIPIPKVDSVILKFNPLYKYVEEIDPKDFMKFVHICFSKRRKTIKNNLKEIIPDTEKYLTEVQIDPSSRPEDIPIETYIQLYKKLLGRRGANKGF
ncbi:16S rRNA (adenine(1518)-N(6)/adenine(1519)-N(6))-dimethyltransferase RsmA [Petrotoga sp. Shatin.DS.tank11.9.2.9.3]|uniref:16S rRNA (adenine(1518)-N(6)/adenine(1519)-N(6))- dimethyltransferase RsmA n=1 Tax=Petrotoga sp. Shatin.DS.tank11.9.2.9.3 TaxID=1469556 RepID=UPI000EF179C3|nr:16S rRNA (adenine(1518)-N(6)/adenine(1519)-N(6))-dimethyltransferase RsmA [Petrotoga sp. Shatin.DS.tank11.9.2.9.3]RLL86144.1 dimethyladenosine transferase [Petrotoga sp. Shatin.DS.tank11.9.2.9.3]